MLSVRRFRALIDSYGADLRRWPDSDRPPAQLLLEALPEARRLLDEARRLDEKIAAAAARQDAELWAKDEPDAALARLRDRIAVRIAARTAALPLRRRPLGWTVAGFGRAHSAAFRHVSMVAGSGAAVVIGLWIGWVQSTPSAPVDLLTMLQLASIRGLGW